jgi:hypothetical protein
MNKVVIIHWKSIDTCPALPGVRYTVGNWNEEDGCMQIWVAEWRNACDFMNVPVEDRPFSVEEAGWWHIEDHMLDADLFGQPNYWLPE